jgi:GR25 family glycosyltransferase involved in LPS biosynthesis
MQPDINTYFDKIFYINLRKDTDRNQRMMQQFGQLGITNYERIEAIPAAGLPHVALYRNFNKKDEKYITGQIGCRASHLHCIALARQRAYTRVLILEDDVLILQHPGELLRQNADILNDWDMLYFGGLIEHFFRNQIVCTHAYAVRNTMYDDILYMAESSGMEIDNFYAKILHHMSYNYNQSGKYNIRIILPFNQLVQDKNLQSNIQSS